MIIISKQLVNQKYIFKLNCARLRKANWKLTLSLAEARKNNEIVSLADSQVLRWLDELNGVVDAEERATQIRHDIRMLRREPPSTRNRHQIKRLYAELDSVQFKPDYLCVVFEKKKDYIRACKGFEVNGVKYRRLLGTNGGIKDKTIVFMSERHADEIERRINNDRDMQKELVPAKLEAYKALACSASTPVSLPKGILVVNDCETEFREDIIHLDDSGVDEPIMELRKQELIQLDESDGYGIMLPSLAQRWSEEAQLGYTTCGFNTRFAWEKGMVFTFDFLDFADKVAQSYMVADAWGNQVDIRNVELILTTSMVKLWDSYQSCDDYIEKSLANGYTFAITKCCPEELEEQHTLNYQFIQSYDLSDEDIEKLIAPTVNTIKDILGNDPMKTILFLCGSGLDDKKVCNYPPIYAKALMVEPSVINDPYIQTSLHSLIKKTIDRAKIGVLNVHGNYSIIGGDPYALCQHIFGLEVTGILKAGEVYNGYWRDVPSEKLVCFRAPMSCHNNIRSVRVNSSPEADYWYRYATTCTFLNAWDAITHALNGADKHLSLASVTAR